MFNLQRILFPIDLSDQCRSAAPFVRNLAARFNAQIVLLHVVELPSGYASDPAYLGLIDIEEMHERRENRVQAFLSEEFGGASASTVVLDGDPASNILEVADREKVDLIMMPTHGYGPFRRFLLGSVTAKVLHDARCPVWTFAHVPATEPDAEIEAGHGVRNILCAVDLMPSCAHLIEWSAKCAEAFGSTLTLVHAIAAPEPWEPESDPFRNFLFRAAEEELAKLQAKLGTKFPACVVAGPVAQVIQHAAANHQADLIVIGRGALQKTFGQLRSQTYEIIRESPCPVISV